MDPAVVQYADLDVIWAIVVVVAVIASLIGKAKKEKQAQDWRRRLSETKPEDLPEATRRQLYGPTAQDLPEATRRQLYGPPQARKAQPRGVPQNFGPGAPAQAEGRNLEGEGVNDEGRRAFPAPPPQRQRTPAPVAVEMETRRLQDELRRQAAEAARLRQELDRERAEGQRRQEELRRSEAARKQAAQRGVPQQAGRQPAQRPPQRKPEPEGQRPVLAARGVQMTTIEEAMRRQAPGQKRRPSWLIQDTRDLRKSIVMMEVLGPPKSMQ